ncbi:MAG: hypothetical protein ACJAZM_001256 [Cyclobacteriaceae bacterium]|jgi:hypothetical protein
MVKPVQFHRNEQTAVNNYFQQEVDGVSNDQIQKNALEEFDLFVDKLRLNKVHVEVFVDTTSSETPDSIFPNNWFTMHDDGLIIKYPMFAENRRKERRDDIIEQLRKQFVVNNIYSFSDWENSGMFLEGTGSLILDRPNKVAYAAISERTSLEVLNDFCSKTNYVPVTFDALQTVDGKRLAIYHTNVMMSVGENFAVVCLDCIDDPVERAKVEFNLKRTGKEIIRISEQQVKNFAGNILQVRNANGSPIIVMSQAANQAFTSKQLRGLEKQGQILNSPIPTIEKYGGGGVRCMMAEIFLPTPTLKTF